VQFLKYCLLWTAFLSVISIAFIVNMWIQLPKREIERSIEKTELIVGMGRTGGLADINYWINLGYLKSLRNSQLCFAWATLILFLSLLTVFIINS
jgi:hypothetical protein